MTNSASSKPQNYTSLAAIRSQSTPTQLVDILMTNEWTSSIAQFSSVPLPSQDLPANGAPPLDELYATSNLGTTLLQKEDNLQCSGNENPTHGIEMRQSLPIREPGCLRRRGHHGVHLSAKAKRPIEGNGENFIFGSVQHPNKRSRVGGEVFLAFLLRSSSQHSSSSDSSGKPLLVINVNVASLPRCVLMSSARQVIHTACTQHFINDCPERVKPPEGYICRICNEPGHLVRDCPTKHAVGDTGGRKPREGYVCRACGSEGHYIDDCPVANQRHPQGNRRGKRGPPKEIGRTSPPHKERACIFNAHALPS
ncbi:nuclear protein [Salix suchowensis]|nr:nuclear protein [Salix suchowensis]